MFGSLGGIEVYYYYEVPGGLKAHNLQSLLQVASQFPVQQQQQHRWYPVLKRYFLSRRPLPPKLLARRRANPQTSQCKEGLVRGRRNRPRSIRATTAFRALAYCHISCTHCTDGLGLQFTTVAHFKGPYSGSATNVEVEIESVFSCFIIWQ
jgi:hypothetical protein